ncbi:MAG TPA: hypothetical protein PK104_06485 [Spirochaetota bacterium]|jgi:hypothetical protein|nr:hypothetical protein [Spirochaetota bacterium]
MKKLIYIILFIFINQVLLASGKVSGGITIGYQNDVGNFDEKSGASVDYQNNLSLGGIFKFDMGFVFFRSGVEYSYPIEKGKIRDGSIGNLEYTKIIFWEVPVYGGLNLTIRDYGSLYFGGGGSYIFGYGYVEGASKNKIDTQLFGTGFIAGIESEIFNDMSFLVEWEYMSVRSSPVASTGTYKDVTIDYSGNRFRIGCIYHFNRYD